MALYRSLILACVALALAVACSPRDDNGDNAAPPTPPDVTPAEPCIEDASDEHDIVRLPGDDAAEVAACVARTDFDRHHGGVVVLAIPDETAGAAAVAYAAHHEVPLLLADPDGLSSAAATEIRRLAPEEVHLVGGTTDAREAVLADTTALFADLEVVPADIGPVTALGDETTVFVASPAHLPSALLAASSAARLGGTLVLVAGDALPDAALEVARRADEIVVVGGYDAVSADVESALRESGGEVRRLSGIGRAEVAGTAARALPPSGGVIVSPEADTATATVAAHAAIVRDAAVLYAEPDLPGRGTDRYLRVGGLAPGTPITLVGGTAALSPDLVGVLERRVEEAADGGPAPQMRGVWIHLFDGTLKTRRGIDEMLDLAAAANLNTVIVEVVRRHDAYYDSDVLPRTPDPTLEDDLDVLDRVIVGAQDRGLSVHAWAPAMPAYHHVYDDLDLPAGHVWREHGPGSDDPWVSFAFDGAPRGEYLDPGVPGVQDLVVDTFAEIAARYPVDAIHHDYIRYDGRDMGYNPTALARFREETGRTDRPSPDDRQWSEWRREQTRTLAARVAEAVREADPSVAISMAASTMGASPATAGRYESTRTWADVFQDWPSWLAAGYVDAVFPMHYFRDGDDRFARWYREWVGFTAQAAEACREQRTDGCVAAVGIGAWLNPVPASLAQTEYAAERTDGMIVYSYQQNADTEPYDALLRALPGGPFAEPAPPPALR